MMRRCATKAVTAVVANAAARNAVRAVCASSQIGIHRLHTAPVRCTKAAKVAAAEKEAKVATPSSGPVVSYVVGSSLSRSSAPEAVSYSLTTEQLVALRAGATTSDLTVEALLNGPCPLFTGAAPIALASIQDFKAAAGETLWVYPTGAKNASYPRILLVGLGAAKEVTLASYRSASWKAISSFQALLLTRVGLLLPSPPRDAEQRFFDSHFRGELVANVARVAILAEHYFRRYLSAEQIAAKKKNPMVSIDLIDLQPTTATTAAKGKKAAATSAGTDHAHIVAAQSIIASATIAAREWANERGDVATPAFMEAEARAVAAKHKLKITVFQDADLAKEGLNLIRAVGQAGVHKARLVVLEYRGDSSPSAGLTAIVGKGVTFDTGGLLIKGRGNMEGMHLDMSGSAAVLGVMSALPALKVNCNVVCVLALCENAISHEAYKPLAILRSTKGSVEITDTDAEGRLALADAMSYVQRAHSPDVVIDVATLTGAAVVALGEHTAALFTNSETLARDVLAASADSGEQAWRMPVTKDFADELKSPYADFRNTAGTRWGGACTAAAFLQKYVEPGVQWAHLDIAGPAMLSKPKEWVPEGGTGFGVQLLVEYFQTQAATRAATSASALTPEQIKEALSKTNQEQ